jgi:predicted nucleic acid-binding protein
VIAGWLLDTSALEQAHHREVTRLLEPLLRSGLLHSTSLLDLEALAAAATADGYRALEAERRAAYRRTALDQAVADRALALQALLSRRGRYRVVEPRDLVVAASALEHNLSVLHYRRVFEFLSDLCGLHQQPVAPLGSLR